MSKQLSIVTRSGAGFGSLAPPLHFRPELSEGTKLGSLADEDGDFFLQGIWMVRRSAHIFDVLPELFENPSLVIQDDHAVSGVTLRSPEVVGLMAAESARETVARTEEVDGAGLSVVLSEDAAIVVFVCGDAVPRLSGFGDDLLPAELVGVPLRQSCACVAVLHDRELEGKILHVRNEAVRRKNRDHYRHEMSATDEQDDGHGGLQPSAPWLLNRRLDHDCPCGQQHGVNRGEVVILAVEREEHCITN